MPSGERRAAPGRSRRTARSRRQLVSQDREHHDVNLVATLEVARPQQSLTREAEFARQRQRCLVVRQRGHLDADELPLVERPFAGCPDGAAADAAPARPWRQPEAHLGAVVAGLDVVEVDAAQEGVRSRVGDREVAPLAVLPEDRVLAQPLARERFVGHLLDAPVNRQLGVLGKRARHLRGVVDPLRSQKPAVALDPRTRGSHRSPILPLRRIATVARVRVPRLQAIAVVVALAFPTAALAAGSEPTPTTPSPTPPTTSTPAPTPTAPAVPAQPSTPAAKDDRTGTLAIWLAAIIGALVVLSAVFAGLAWWSGWSAERFVGRRGASWDGLGEFGDWI